MSRLGATRPGEAPPEWQWGQPIRAMGRDGGRSRRGGGGAGGACPRVTDRWAGQWRGVRPAAAPSGAVAKARRGEAGAAAGAAGPWTA